MIRLPDCLDYLDYPAFGRPGVHPPQVIGQARAEPVLKVIDQRVGQRVRVARRKQQPVDAVPDDLC